MAWADRVGRERVEGMAGKLCTIRIGVCIAAVLFATCASAFKLDTRGEPKSVGIISLLGDAVSLAYEPLLIGGIHEKVPVGGIGFDALAEATATECAHAANPQLAFRKIDIPKGPLIEKLTSGLLARYNATMPQIRPAIFEWAKRHPVDLIMVIREIYTQVPGGPSQYFGGVGVHQFVNNRAIVQATLGLSVWDGKTADGITDRFASPIAGVYPGRVEQLYDELKGGHHVPALESVLRRLVGVGVCEMAKAAKL
jgi:hypothetical protein